MPVRGSRPARAPRPPAACPHYLLLDEAALLRASDHVGWPAERKHGPDIFALASGAPGVELIVPLVHDAFGLGRARSGVPSEPNRHPVIFIAGHGTDPLAMPAPGPRCPHTPVGGEAGGPGYARGREDSPRQPRRRLNA